MERLWGSVRMWWRRCLSMARRSRLDDELRDEIGQHIDLRRQALIEEGMDPQEAAAQAQRMFGNVTVIREQTRDLWGFPSLDTVMQDIRYGARLLHRSPTVTIASILSLAIGIGFSAGVFSLADVILLRPLPVRAPDELLVFQWRSGPRYPFSSLSGTSWGDDTTERSTSFSLETVRQARRQAQDVIDVFGFAGMDRVSLGIDGIAELAEADAVSGNYFSVLGLVPAQGRLLVDSDDRAEATPSAVISDSLWRRRFNASPETVGRTLVINATPFTVVGVTPPSFRGTGQVDDATDVYVPLSHKRQVLDRGDTDDPNHWWVLMMGRLKAGSTSELARGRLDAILKQTVRAARPETTNQELPSVEALSGRQGQVQVRDRMREPLQMMSIVVVIVLLVGCANVANLLLARGRVRARELSVRIALGAPRRRIVRQLLTEGMILAAYGSALGLLAARWIAEALLPALQLGPDALAVAAELNVRVVAFVGTLASVCVALFALVPALRSTDTSLGRELHEAGRGSSTGRRRRGLSATLVISQITLSMVLVATALLLVRSIRQLQQVDLGFDASRVLTFKLDPGLTGYEGEGVVDVYTRILERLRAAPGVEQATLSNQTLVSNSANVIVAARTDEPVVDARSADRHAFTTRHLAWRLAVDSHFFETMGMRIDLGRAIEDRDSRTSQPVAVINYALARQLFNTTDVVGRQFRTESRSGPPLYEIIGLCTDAVYSSLREAKTPTMYVAYRQHGAGPMTFEVRTAGDPAAFAPTAREIVRSVDPHLSLFRVRTQEEQIAVSLSRERLFARLATWLAAVALILSAIGLYALLAYMVTLRTGEIGIRMALGADRGDVRWMIVRQSVLVAVCGVLCGIVASAAGTNLLRALLFNVEPRDTATFAASAAIIFVVTAIAGYIPARRASRVDPLVALRAD